MKKRLLLILIIVVVLLASFGILAIVYLNTLSLSIFPVSTIPPEFTATPFILLTVVGPLGIDTVDDLERFLGASLPKDATNVEFVDYNIALQEAAINVRFEIPANSEALSQFLSFLGFSSPLRDGYYPFQENNSEFVMDYFEWWKPKNAKSYVGSAFGKPQESWSVMIDKSNSEQYIVYLMAILM